MGLEGCSSGDCGACSVTVDGRLICSCLMLAVEAEGHKIETIEGMARGQDLHPLQQKFLEHAALQCGFCTPGLLVAAKALLDRNPNPTETETRYWLAAPSVGAPATTRSSVPSSMPPRSCEPSKFDRASIFPVIGANVSPLWRNPSLLVFRRDYRQKCPWMLGQTFDLVAASRPDFAIFPVSREFQVETGSHRTESSASQSSL